MDSHPAVVALHEGCTQLRIPFAAAAELCKYLLTKRIYQKERGSDLGCSSTLDELQHWLLLETRLREQVEALIGGKICTLSARWVSPAARKWKEGFVLLSASLLCDSLHELPSVHLR